VKERTSVLQEHNHWATRLIALEPSYSDVLDKIYAARLGGEPVKKT